jgi:hypothetical protein
MDQQRLDCIMSGLSQYELTDLERRFVQWVNRCVADKSGLTEEQELVLEGVYLEKTGFIRNAVLSMLG